MVLPDEVNDGFAAHVEFGGLSGICIKLLQGVELRRFQFRLCQSSDCSFIPTVLGDPNSD